MNFRNMLAWHSKKINVANVHHNNTNCKAGNRIEIHYLEQGTGGRPICRRCEALNKAMKSKRANLDRPSLR
jgi:hypothetical protein